MNHEEEIDFVSRSNGNVVKLYRYLQLVMDEDHMIQKNPRDLMEILSIGKVKIYEYLNTLEEENLIARKKDFLKVK